MRLAPGFATAYTFLGLIARERGDHMQAASLFQLCARLDRVDTREWLLLLADLSLGSTESDTREWLRFDAHSLCARRFVPLHYMTEVRCSRGRGSAAGGGTGIVVYLDNCSREAP